eukprot:CAMPEP_0175368490 /NCGR_PEP_ID=MMETSP0095-20121207/20211_1 /TAXON_ID=311494 /ORGANISM="Alexandrium monilatum, Strain CCMP3105" /LENGTH=447 /DNA_ID=CAMNT_0016666593 /DNA_START=32 /DNA_END=1375 /DNA_ORIENTATION=+
MPASESDTVSSLRANVLMVEAERKERHEALAKLQGQLEAQHRDSVRALTQSLQELRLRVEEVAGQAQVTEARAVQEIHDLRLVLESQPLATLPTLDVAAIAKTAAATAAATASQSMQQGSSQNGIATLDRSELLEELQQLVQMAVAEEQGQMMDLMQHRIEQLECVVQSIINDRVEQLEVNNSTAIPAQPMQLALLPHTNSSGGADGHCLTTPASSGGSVSLSQRRTGSVLVQSQSVREASILRQEGAPEALVAPVSADHGAVELGKRRAFSPDRSLSQAQSQDRQQQQQPQPPRQYAWAAQPQFSSSVGVRGATSPEHSSTLPAGVVRARSPVSATRAPSTGQACSVEAPSGARSPPVTTGLHLQRFSSPLTKSAVRSQHVNSSVLPASFNAAPIVKYLQGTDAITVGGGGVDQHGRTGAGSPPGMRPRSTQPSALPARSDAKRTQ